MNKRLLYTAPAVFFVICLISTLIFQSMSKPVLSKKDMHQQIVEFQSYNQETELLLDQYEKGRITYTYLSEQLGQIQKQILSTVDIFESNKILPKDENNLRKLANLATKYAIYIERIENKNDDRTKILKEGENIKSIDQDLEKLSKDYE